MHESKFILGQRVKVIHPIDLGAEGYFPPGMSGIVSNISSDDNDDLIGLVKLDDNDHNLSVWYDLGEPCNLWHFSILV